MSWTGCSIGSFCSGPEERLGGFSETSFEPVFNYCRHLYLNSYGRSTIKTGTITLINVELLYFSLK